MQRLTTSFASCRDSLRQGKWRGAVINLDREVAVNIATSAGLIDDRHQISKTPSIEAWAEVEKLLGVTVLLFVVFMEYLSIGVIFPGTVFYARMLGADSWEAGVVLGITLGTMAVFAKGQARFAKAFGIRPVTTFGLICMFAGYFVQWDAVSLGQKIGWSHIYVSRCEKFLNLKLTTDNNTLVRYDYCEGKRRYPFALETLIIGRIIAGVGGSIVPVARSYIKELCPGKEGVKFTFILHVVVPFATLMGYALAPGISQFDGTVDSQLKCTEKKPKLWFFWPDRCTETGIRGDFFPGRSAYLLAMGCTGFAFIVALLFLKEVRDIHSILREVPEDDWQMKLRDEFASSMKDLTETLDVKVDVKQLQTLLPPSIRVLLEPRGAAPRRGAGSAHRSQLGLPSVFRTPLAEIQREERLIAEARENGPPKPEPGSARALGRSGDQRAEMVQVTLTVYTVLMALIVAAQFILEASLWGFLVSLPHSLADGEAGLVFTISEYGFLIVGIGVLIPLTQAMVYPFVAPRAGKHMTAAIGTLFMVLSLFGATFADWNLGVKSTFFGSLVFIFSPMPIGYALAKAASAALLKRYCRPPVAAKTYRKSMLAYQAASAMGAFIGCMSFGGLYDEDVWYPYYVNGGWTMLAFILFMQIYAENSMLAEHKERDDEDFEVKRFWKMVTIAAHCICIPWCTIRAGLGIHMCLEDKGWGHYCDGVLFKVYVCIAISTVVLCFIPEAVLGLGLGNNVVAVVAFWIHKEWCYGTKWMNFITADICVWWAVLILAFVFLTTSVVLRPEVDAVYSRFVRIFCTPIFLSRAVIGMVIFINPYEYKTPCSAHVGVKAAVWLSILSIFSCFSPKALTACTCFNIAFSTLVMSVSGSGSTPCGGRPENVWHVPFVKEDGDYYEYGGIQYYDWDRRMEKSDANGRRLYLFQFLLMDTCVSLVGLAACYCAWFALLSPLEEVRNKVQVVAGYGVGIPISLARLLFGYLLCGSKWYTDTVVYKEGSNLPNGTNVGDRKYPDCNDLWVFKVYVVFAMLSFLAVRRLRWFQTHTVLLAMWGFYAVANVGGQGCDRWRTFVIVDLWASIGLGSLAYFAWTHFKGHQWEHDPAAAGSIGSKLYKAHHPDGPSGRHLASPSQRPGMSVREARPSHVLEIDPESGSLRNMLDAQDRDDDSVSPMRSAANLVRARNAIKRRAMERRLARLVGDGTSTSTPPPLESHEVADKLDKIMRDTNQSERVPTNATNRPKLHAVSSTSGSVRRTTPQSEWTTTVRVGADMYPVTLCEGHPVSYLMSEVMRMHEEKHPGDDGNIVGLQVATGHELDIEEDVTRCVPSGEVLDAVLAATKTRRYF